jgi:glucosamine--fructose-6-phosphate aminotransferase (isomerizing)
MKTNFESDIYSQPEVIRKMVADNSNSIADLAQYVRSKSPRFVLIAARGTSDNAAVYAKYLFGALNKTPVGLAMPSLYSLYQQPPDMRGGVVIGISQSGQTPDVLSIIEEAKKQKVPNLSITNEVASPIAKLADHAIILSAGKEMSVPASKTYTAQMVALAQIAAHWSGDQQYLDDLSRLSGLIEEVLTQHENVITVAKAFGHKDHLIVVGRGMNHCTTAEIALKIKELSYMVAQAYSAADFRHGPIAMLEEGFPVVSVAPRGKTIGDMRSMIADIRATGANQAVISNDAALLAISKLPVQLPESLPEWLSPIVATVPGQLLALHLALEKGLDPDKPRGLKKVTLTL